MSIDKPGIAILVTGTALNVGKTFVASGLARSLRSRGLSVGVMKPIEVGWMADGGEWPTDADALRQAADVDDGPEDVCPYVFEDMLAPQLAADKVRIPIEPERILASLDKLRAKYDIVLVEGVGGLAVPIDDGYDLADLAAECRLPVLLVSPAHIGTLNASFLTVHYARTKGLEVIGIVANRFDRTLDDPTASTNVKMLERMCKVPVLGVVPDSPMVDSVEGVGELCDTCFDLPRFCDLLGLTPA